MTKPAVYISLALTLLLACCRKAANQEELAMNAATQYYGYLLAGDYEAFVDGTWHADTLRQAYRAQLVDNAKMFMAQQQKERQGIKSATARSAELDSLQTSANVFLILDYGDGTQEQALLPLVRHDGMWYLR